MTRHRAHLDAIFARYTSGGDNWHTKQNVAFYGLLRGADRRGSIEGVPRSNNDRLCRRPLLTHAYTVLPVYRLGPRTA